MQRFCKMKRRIGKIKISWPLIKNAYSTKRSDLYSLFAKFIPVCIESNPILDQVVYWGTSYCFDEISEGEEVPFYDAIITVTDGENLIEFKRL